MIFYAKHTINSDDLISVKKVLLSSNLTQGSEVNKFENNLKKYFSAKYACVTSSGTAALHLVALAYGWKKGDIVITTPMSFVATANCIEYTGAKPYFIDIDAKTGNMSTINLEKTLKKLNKTNKKVKAVICVDYAGSICDWKSLKKISRKYKVNLINDNCHAIGSRLEGDQGYALKYADVVTHSYHPAKNITTGEGGSVLTNDKKIYEKILTLRTHGIKKLAKNRLWYYEMQNLGFNYRLSDLQSALGSSQLKRLNLFIKKRNYIADTYNKTFRNIKNIQIPIVNKSINHSYHLYPLLIDFKKIGISKISFFKKMKKNGFQLQVHYIPIHYHPYYKKKYNFKNRDFPNAEDFYNRQVSLPIYPSLKKKDQLNIIRNLLNIVNEKKIK